jgi:hypothetical protein
VSCSNALESVERDPLILLKVVGARFLNIFRLRAGDTLKRVLSSSWRVEVTGSHSSPRPVNGRFRRILAIAGRSGEGPLSELTGALRCRHQNRARLRATIILHGQQVPC